MFTVVAGPSPEINAVGKEKKELAEVEKKRVKFFTQLLEKLNNVIDIFQNISPAGYQGWVLASAKKSGLS